VADFFVNRKWDLVGPRLWWFAISLAIIVPGLISWTTKGLNYGIDFTGGGLITYQLPQPIAARDEVQTVGEVRSLLERAGIARLEVQLSGTAGRKDQIMVRTQATSNAEVTAQDRIVSQVLQQRFPGTARLSIELVGATVSKDLIKRALTAILISSLMILVYISVRYQFKFAVCAIIALVHDLLVLAGSFALLQQEINSPFVAALLTVVGFSVHDTIVIFDRIRENIRLRKEPVFADLVNVSILETLTRSINTGLATQFTLIALYFLGGPTLREFVLAMIIGIAVGTYSSIFNASQILVVWKQREERGRPTPARVGPAPRTAPAPRPVSNATAAEFPAPSEGGTSAAVTPESSPQAAAKRKASATGRAPKRKRRF
jgi:preprotein translocase subunit SecF